MEDLIFINCRFQHVTGFFMEVVRMEMSVSELLAVTREIHGRDYVEGDRIMCEKRYKEETAHMIEYLSSDGADSLEKKSRYKRRFLTESGYRHALEEEAQGKIQIIRYARLKGSNLEYILVPRALPPEDA